MKWVYPDQVGEHNLVWLIQVFVYKQQHPGPSACNIPDLPLFYETITIHPSAVATFHTPSDLSSIGGMKRECIHTVSCWKRGPGHYNTLFINATANDVDDNCYIWPTGSNVEPKCGNVYSSLSSGGTLVGRLYPLRSEVEAG